MRGTREGGGKRHGRQVRSSHVGRRVNDPFPISAHTCGRQDQAGNNVRTYWHAIAAHPASRDRSARPAAGHRDGACECHQTRAAATATTTAAAATAAAATVPTHRPAAPNCLATRVSKSRRPDTCEASYWRTSACSLDAVWTSRAVHGCVIAVCTGTAIFGAAAGPAAPSLTAFAAFDEAARPPGDAAGVVFRRRRRHFSAAPAPACAAVHTTAPTATASAPAAAICAVRSAIAPGRAAGATRRTSTSRSDKWWCEHRRRPVRGRSAAPL